MAIVDPFVPHSAVCNRRSGFTPTADEQHYVSFGFAPTDIVRLLYGPTPADPADAEWQKRRVESLTAWREVWREGFDALDALYALDALDAPDVVEG